MMQINTTNFSKGTGAWDNNAKLIENNAKDPENQLSQIYSMSLTTKNYVSDVTSSNNNDQADKITDSDKEKSNDKMEYMNIDNTELSFKRHEGTGEIMVKIINSDTGEIIREIPPERLLDSIAQIFKNSGVGVDKIV